MSTTSGLGAGAIAGIAAGGAIILLVPALMLVVLLVRSRRKRNSAAHEPRWSILPGRRGIRRDQSYHSIDEPIRPPHREIVKQQRRSKRLPLPTWTDAQPRFEPTVSQSPQTSQLPSPWKPSNRAEPQRLSWPRPSNGATREIFSTWHNNIIRLSPITESPLSRSLSSPDLASPRIGPSRLSLVAFPGIKKQQQDAPKPEPAAPETMQSHQCKATERIARVERVHAPPTKRPSVYSLWRTRMGSLTTLRQSRKTQKTSKEDLVSTTEEKTAAQPEEKQEEKFSYGLREHHPGQLRVVNADDEENEKAALQEANKDTDSVTSKQGELPASPRSSRTSDGLSMYEGKEYEFDSVVPVGLRSPSRREGQKRKTGATPHKEARRSKSDNFGGLLRENSSISLSTMGRRRSVDSAEIRTSRADDLRTDRIILTPSSNPAARMSGRGSPISSPVITQPVSDHGINERKPRNKVLRELSGNRGEDGGKTPQSEPAQRPKTWKPDPNRTESPVSALKGKARKQGHKRQNCVRISTMMPMVIPAPSRSSSIAEEPTKQGIPQTPPSSPPARSKSQRPLPQPPSVPSFNPQLSPLHGKGLSADRPLQDDSPTDPRLTKVFMSAVNPSRREGLKTGGKLNSTAPNISRLSTGSSVFTDPVTASSRPESLLVPPQGETLKNGGSIGPSSVLAAIKEPTPLNAYSSPFDVTPLRTRNANSSPTVRPSSIIRGPRSPPNRRSTVMQSSPTQDLCRSVMALRRMNSDLSIARSDSGRSGRSVKISRSRSSRHYLNLNRPSAEKDGKVSSARAERGSASEPRPSTISSDEFGSPSRKKTKLEPQSAISTGIKKPFRDPKGFVMPSPRTDGRIGLGLMLDENGDVEYYDQDGFLIT